MVLRKLGSPLSRSTELNQFPPALCSSAGAKTCVVISQTHRLVSQERLSPRVGTSIFIDLIQSRHLVSGGSNYNFTAGVSHHTPPLVGGIGNA